MVFQTFFDKLFKLRDNKNGVAAVEFALSVPMMMFGVVIMTDLGLAIHERMNLDQAVRSGAEFVMNDISDETQLQKLILASANGSYSDGDENSNDVDPYAVKAPLPTKTCECPDAPGTSVSCTNYLCSNNMPPSVYYFIEASRKYDALILPDIALSTQITVQVR